MIRSSEIASYLYCPVSWWIGLTKGVKVTSVMKKGEKHHETVSKNSSKAKFLYISIILAIMVILILILFRVLT